MVPNIGSTDCPSTAFLTGKCIDALESVLEVFQRRRKRFERLLGGLRTLQQLEARRNRVRQFAAEGLISEEMFDAGYRYQGRNLVREIRACLRELCLDNSLPNMYKAWERAARDVAATDGTEFGNSICRALARVVKGDAFQDEATRLADVADHNLKIARNVLARVKAIHAAADTLRKGGSPDRLTGTAKDDLPGWICNEDYWTTTQRALFEKATSRPPEVYDALERHWRRQSEACEAGVELLNEFNSYLRGALGVFRRLATSPTADAAALIECFQ